MPHFHVSPLITSEGAFSEHTLAIYLGAVGIVVLISALVSGFIERGPFSQVLVFILMGVVAGPWGIEAIDFEIASPAVQTVGTISLVLVFFTDAIKINLGQLRRGWILPALALGPGAVLTIAIITLSARVLFDFSWTLSLLIGAVLASTDAVLLRDVLNDKRVPRSVRNTLSIEAGTNDVIVLPVVLILATIAAGVPKNRGDWAEFAFDLYILGPLTGIAIGYLAIRAMVMLRKRWYVRHDYESLYSIGVAFVAFAAAQLIGGSGFLAAFTAGLIIAVMDEELCDCFMEYGETTGEMAMLLTFVFIGASLASAAQDAFGWRTVLFALLVLLVARPVAFGLTLFHADISRAGKAMLAWFGPRGLNSLLLTILAVLTGMPQSGEIFGIVAVVVLASVLLHGTSATPALNWYERLQHSYELPEETAVTAAALLHVSEGPRHPEDVPRMSVSGLNELISTRSPHTVIDVRRHSSDDDERAIPGSLRIPVDEILRRLMEIPKGPPVVLSCA